ncbi:hypothetical protein [Allocoleopsis sp.]|uniref:hypothetical protein n=1 Tax=Allocoleopsis sp. TaxID=3088169 RepID=UPI002FD33278
MNRIFKHIHTAEVVEVPEIRPGVLNFKGCIVEVSEISLHNWEECESDPGYRGLPPEEEKSLD